jgi:hypothetical protein
MAIDYKIALKLLVIHKRIILVKDACQILKRKDISSTIHSLVRENKINTKLIDVRGQNNVVRAMKILFVKDIKEDELLEFEKISLSKVVNSNVIVEKKNSKQKLKIFLDVPEYTVINGQGGILIKVHNGNSVVNKNDIADFHEKLILSVVNIINSNIHKLIKEVDYFAINEELLFTKSGYLKLAESFDDKLSQRVRNQMLVKYFKYQNIILPIDNPVNNNKASLTYVSNDIPPGILKSIVDQMSSYAEELKAMERKLVDLRVMEPILN